MLRYVRSKNSFWDNTLRVKLVDSPGIKMDDVRRHLARVTCMDAEESTLVTGKIYSTHFANHLMGNW